MPQKNASHLARNQIFKFSLLDQKDLEIDEVEEFLDSKNVQTPHCKLRRYQGSAKVTPPLQDSANQTCESMCLEKERSPGSAVFIPQIPKIPESVGTDRVRTVGQASKTFRLLLFSHMSRRKVSV